MPFYNVAQGDCISSIAFRFGFLPDTIWTHWQNAELSSKRLDPNVLFPGDSIFIPDKTLREENAATDQRHIYKRKGVPKKLKVRFLRNNTPLANQNYILEIDGNSSQGATDGDGNLECSIVPNAHQAKVTFPNFNEDYSLDLGFLDPVDEVSGVKARLKSLGFYVGEVNGQMDEATRNAITAFQTSQGIPNGELDQCTKDDLKAAFGS
jgi:hypothetical protein